MDDASLSSALDRAERALIWLGTHVSSSMLACAVHRSHRLKPEEAD